MFCVAWLASAPAVLLANPASFNLHVSGKVLRGEPRALDLAALGKLPQHTFVTRTPWTPNAQKFTGPLLRDVLALVGAQGSTIKALALDDYQIAIPVADAQQYDVVVARLIDDKPIPVRERGPLFIIYPFDQRPELQATRYYERSIWQLKSIVIE